MVIFSLCEHALLQYTGAYQLYTGLPLFVLKNLP